MLMATSVVHVREVVLADLSGCCVVETECFSPEEAASPGAVEQRIRNYSEGFLVAEAQSNGVSVIAGMINSGCTHKTDITDEAFKQLVGHDPAGANLVVFSLSVRPEWQGRGLARELMERFADRGKELGKQRILLLCKDYHIDFYQRLGFVHGGISASEHGGAVWHEMRMEL